MNIEAIAIDDEPKALEVIQLLSEKVPFLTLKATFTDAFKAIPYLQQHHVDLLFFRHQNAGYLGIGILAFPAQ